VNVGVNEVIRGESANIGVERNERVMDYGGVGGRRLGKMKVVILFF